MSPTTAGDYEPLGARVYWIQGQQRRTSTRSPPAIAGRPVRPNLHYMPERRGLTVIGPWTRRGLGGTFAPTLVRDAGGGAAASEEGAPRRRPEHGRQAPAFRPRGSGRVPGAARRRCLPDARGGRGRSASYPGRQGHRRRQDADQRGARGDAAAAAPVRAPSPLQRRRCARASARWGSTWSRRSYLLIDARTSGRIQLVQIH